SAPNFGRRDGDQSGEQNRRQTNPNIEWASTYRFNGHWSEIEANRRDDRTCHDRWHQSLDPADAESHDDQSYDAVQHTGRKYTAKRDIQVRVWPLPGIAGCGNDDSNEGEA